MVQRVGCTDYELTIFAIFAGKDFFKLEDRSEVLSIEYTVACVDVLRIDRNTAVALEDLCDCGEDLVA